MEAIQNQILRIISSIHQSKDMEEVVEVLTLIFEWLSKENNDIISTIKNKRYETNDLISNLKHDISTLEKKVDSLSVKININNKYEH